MVSDILKQENTSLMFAWHYTEHGHHTWVQALVKHFFWSPARVDQLKIFTWNWKDCQLQGDLGLV